MTGLVHHVELALRARLGARSSTPPRPPPAATPSPPPATTSTRPTPPTRGKSTAAHVCLQGPFQEAPRETILAQLLAKIGRNEAFACLRTTEQLGAHHLPLPAFSVFLHLKHLTYPCGFSALASFLFYHLLCEHFSCRVYHSSSLTKVSNIYVEMLLPQGTSRR